MKNFKSNIVLSALVSAAALFATTAQADDSKLQNAYKSTNIKAALINVVKKKLAKANS